MVACAGSPAERAPPQVADLPGPSGGSEQNVPAEPAPAPSAGLITDEECFARGGSVETEQTYANEGRRDPSITPTPYRVCRVPSPENGHECRGEEECGRGRCYCTGELSGPDPRRRAPHIQALDGTPAVGICSDEHLPSGWWFCLVRDGRVMLSGIIID